MPGEHLPGAEAGEFEGPQVGPASVGASVGASVWVSVDGVREGESGDERHP